MVDFPIDALTPAERLVLIGELWDSLDETQILLTAAQRDELDARLATADDDAPQGSDWAAVENRLRHRPA